MSPIEHYFENLLIRGSDIKGEPNKNALSKEVQEAIEICAYYIKSINAIPNDSNSEKVAMLTEILTDFDNLIEPNSTRIDCESIIEQKIQALEGKSDGEK